MPESLICAGCALLCDDVTTDGTRLEPECALGAAWLADRSALAADAPEATVAGAPAERETAVAHAVQLLRGARRPRCVPAHIRGAPAAQVCKGETRAVRGP